MMLFGAKISGRHYFVTTRKEIFFMTRKLIEKTPEEATAEFEDSENDEQAFDDTDEYVAQYKKRVVSRDR